MYSLGSESPDFITKYVYSGGRLIEKRTGADKITYKYGPNGSWMEIRSTDPNNGEKEITKYEYDKSKNLLSRVFDVPNRPAYYKEDVYKYDESNKLVWKYFDRNTYYYEYDERGNLIKTVKYEGLFEDLTLPNTDKSPKTTLYYYDNENYLIGLENKDGMYVFIYEKNAD